MLRSRLLLVINANGEITALRSLNHLQVRPRPRAVPGSGTTIASTVAP